MQAIQIIGQRSYNRAEQFISDIVQQGSKLVYEIESIRFQQLENEEREVLGIWVEQFIVSLGYLKEGLNKLSRSCQLSSL